MEDQPDTIGCYRNCDICILRNGKAKKNDPPIPRDLAPISSRRRNAPAASESEEFPPLEPVIFRSDAVRAQPRQAESGKPPEGRENASSRSGGGGKKARATARRRRAPRERRGSSGIPALPVAKWIKPLRSRRKPAHHLRRANGNQRTVPAAVTTAVSQKIPKMELFLLRFQANPRPVLWKRAGIFSVFLPYFINKALRSDPWLALEP